MGWRSGRVIGVLLDPDEATRNTIEEIFGVEHLRICSP